MNPGDPEHESPPSSAPRGVWWRLIVVLLLLALRTGGPLLGQDRATGALDSLLNVPISSAGKHLQTVRDAPASVSIITSDEIARFGWTSLDQLLNSVRGFYSSYDRNYTYLGVRGFGRPTDYNNRLLLLINGHTINEGIWGSTAAGPDLSIDLRSLERVEIVRGPGSALYGNSAVFAVVNLITRSGGAIDGARVYGTVGSYGYREGSVIAGHEFASGLELAFHALAGNTDGQTLHYPELAFDSATGGTIRNLDWEKRRGALLTLAHPRLGLRLQARFTRREKGIPTASFDQIPGDTRARTQDQTAFVELGWEGDLSPAVHVQTRLYGDGYWYQGDYAYADLFAEGVDAKILGGEASARWDLGSRQRITVGGEYRDVFRAVYRYPRSDPSIYLSNPYQVAAGYLQDELDLTEWLTLVGGLRYDHNSRSGGHLSPRVAAVLHPDRATSVKLLYGEAFRAPSVAERDYASTTDGGNTELRAEEITTMELSVQRQLSRELLISGGGFLYRMQRLIEPFVDPADSASIFRNGATAHARGVYADVDWRDPRGWQGSLSGSVTDAWDVDSERQLTNSPAWELKAGLATPLPAKATLGVQSRYESGRRTLPGARTGDFVLTDAYLHWQPRGRLTGLEAGLRVNNVFDVSWATPGGAQHLQPAITQDGRNLLVTLGVRF